MNHFRQVGHPCTRTVRWSVTHALASAGRLRASTCPSRDPAHPPRGASRDFLRRRLRTAGHVTCAGRRGRRHVSTDGLAAAGGGHRDSPGSGGGGSQCHGLLGSQRNESRWLWSSVMQKTEKYQCAVTSLGHEVKSSFAGQLELNKILSI